MIRVEPLPRTATNKIKRFQLKKEIETGVITADAKEPKAWEFTGYDKAMLATGTGKAVIAAILMQKPARKQGLNANGGDKALAKPQASATEGQDVIHPAMNLEIDLGLDSLARAETFAALEQAFSTEFEGDEAARALTVANVIELVNNHGGGDVEQVSVDLNWGKIIREAEDDFPEIRSVLQNRPVFAAFAWSVYKCFWLIFKIFLRLEVKGLENLNVSVPGTVVTGDV